MKLARVTVADGPGLIVSAPETEEELRAGWRLLPNGHDGMLFEIAEFASRVPIWIPIALGDEAKALDVLWINGGIVVAVCTIRGGCLQGFGDSVLEVPAGWAKVRNIALGDSVLIEREIRGH